MTTVATLGIEAHSGSVPKATSDLDKLAASSAKAEAAVESLSKSTAGTSGDFNKLDAGIIRTNELLERLSMQTTYTNAQLTKLNSGVQTGATQHIPRFTKALNDNAAQAGLTANQLLNLSRQGNDALTMFAMGAAPMQIFASQAGQVYGALQEGPGGVAGALKSIRDGLMDTARAFPVVTGLLAAGAVAFTAYKVLTNDGIRSLDEILEDHKKNIASIEDSWDAAKSGARSYTDESISVFEFLFGRTKEETKDRLAKDVNEAVREMRVAIASENPFNDPNITSQFAPFTGLIDELENSSISVGKFREEVTQLGQENPALADAAKKLLDITAAADETARSAASLNEASLALIRLHDAISRVQSDPLREELMKLFDQVKEGDISLADLNKRIAELALQNPSFSGIILGLRQIAIEAWEAGEGLRRAADAAAGREGYNNPRGRPQVWLPPTAPVPDQRPNAEDILAAQEKAAARADKRDPYQDVIRSADQRIRQMQTEISLLGEVGVAAETLRIQQDLLNRATQDGNTLSAEQTAQLGERAKAIALLGEAMKAAKLQQDLLFEREQVGRTPEERSIAQRLRGTGYGIDSPAADFMRGTNRREQLQGEIKGFFTDIRSGLVNGGKDIGESIADSLLNAFNKQMDKAIDSLFERAATALTNLILGPNESLGQPVSVLKDAVSSGMNLGSGGGRSAALNGGTVAEQSWNFFKSKGLADHQVAGILGNIKAESGFNPSAIGDGGLASGLFQHHPARGGGQSLIASGATGQLEHAWRELQGPESGAFSRLMAAGNVREATAAFGGFERPAGWSIGNPEAMHNFTGRLAGAEAALKQFGGTTIQTAASLEGGLGKLGNTLASAAGGSPAGSGGGGWLSSLFGFGGAAGAALSPAAWSVVSGGMMTGLFRDGGMSDSPMRSRLVDPSVFLGAPRLRNGGLMGDDIPAILHPGERVLNRQETQNYNNGGGRVKVEVELVGDGYNIRPSVRRIVHEDAPGIAEAKSVETVSKYHKNMGKGGQARQASAYNSLRANTRYG